MRLSFCSANLRNTSPRCRLSSSYSVFSAALRDEHHMVFALPLRYGLGFPSRPSRTPFRVLWRLTLGSLRDGLLDLSNSYCLPGRAGGSPFVLDEKLFRTGEIDGTDDIPSMSRSDNIWSQCFIFAVGNLIANAVYVGEDV